MCLVKLFLLIWGQIRSFWGFLVGPVSTLLCGHGRRLLLGGHGGVVRLGAAGVVVREGGVALHRVFRDLKR